MNKGRIIGIIIFALLFIFNVALAIYHVAVFSISLAFLCLIILIAMIRYKGENNDDDDFQ